MRCLSCQQEVASMDTSIVVGVYLCRSCGALAQKAVKELEVECDRAKTTAMSTLSQMIMKGDLLRPK